MLMTVLAYRYHPLSIFTKPAITHLPRAGGDPELFTQERHSMPKAATKFAATPSTPPANTPKAPLTVPNSFTPTTALPTETTAPAVAVPDYEDTQMREAEHITIDRWPQPTEFRSFQISFTSDVSHCGLAKLTMHKVLTISSLQHLQQESRYRTSRNLISRLQADSESFLTGSFKKPVSTAE